MSVPPMALRQVSERQRAPAAPVLLKDRYGKSSRNDRAESDERRLALIGTAAFISVADKRRPLAVAGVIRGFDAVAPRCP